MGRTERKEVTPEITIKGAERWNGRLISNGIVDGVRWTASKCHCDPHIQWSVGMPEHHLAREQAEILSIAVCRYLLRNADIIQGMLPVIASQEIKHSTRRRAPA